MRAEHTQKADDIRKFCFFFRKRNVFIVFAVFR